MSPQRNVIEKGYAFRPATAIQSLSGVIEFRFDEGVSARRRLIDVTRVD
jgi:hypothetical protein